MRQYVIASLAASLTALGGPVFAQDNGFTWEGEVEFGVEIIVDSDVPAKEITDVYANFELGAELEISSRVSAFAVIIGESVVDPADDRTFEDIGFYLEELGVSIALFDQADLTLGKFNPSFGRASDDTAGFFADTLAGDYELTEQLGASLSYTAINGGVLDFALFFADNTVLSRSLGTNRGRTRTADGGVGNTGQLDNVALTWTQDFEGGSYQLGGRHLSAGTGGTEDETGLIASAERQFNDSFSAFAEVASFQNFGGGADNATFVTLNGVYSTGDWAFSGTLSHRDLGTAGNTDLVTLAVEYEFANEIVVGSGIAFVDEDGSKDTRLGLNVIVPFGI